MYNVILENENGEQLDLMHQDDMICIHLEGATSMTSTMNETENANIDGSTINSERINSRSINLTVRILNNFGECRTKLYHHATLKKYIKLSIVNDVRSAYIEGKVKSIECDPWTQTQEMIITILCPEPYFNEIMALEEEFSNIIKLLHFPLAIESKGIPFGEITDIEQCEIVNVGEVDTGLEFILRAHGEVENPKIINMKTGEYLRLEHTMLPDEVIKICTVDKKKSVVSIYNNAETNIISHFDLNSTWLNAKVGTTNFTYEADSGSNKLELSIKFKNQYLGT